MEQQKELFSPMLDIVFKSLFTRETPESRIALMDLASCITGRTVTDVRVLNNELPADGVGQILERLDVNCAVDTGERINLEMQAYAMKGVREAAMKVFTSRICYYASDLYSSQWAKGNTPYSKLEKIYQVSFLGIPLFEDEEYLHHFQYRDQNGRLLSDRLNIVVAELGKLKKALLKPVEELSPLEMWGIFLRYADDVTKRDVLNKIVRKRKAIGMAESLLNNISKDEYEHARMISRKKYLCDYYSDLEGSREEGREESRKEIAINMMKKQISLETIAELTGTPLETLENWKEEFLIQE